MSCETSASPSPPMTRPAMSNGRTDMRSKVNLGGREGRGGVRHTARGAEGCCTRQCEGQRGGAGAGRRGPARAERSGAGRTDTDCTGVVLYGQ